ncbi:MAG TPA: SdrD B-like domain-containing protein [Humisphaera sp.]|nr:SdrD B-like domain-containing protein [Humisphaera sp.]
MRSNIELLERRTLLSAVVVNTLVDGLHPAGVVSLRDAVLKANTTAGTTISFDPVVFATPKTITLNGNELDLSGTGTIIKGPAAGVSINGNNLSRIFYITAAATITLSNLTLTNAGRGAIFSSGTLTINHSSIIGNNGSAGAGLYSSGTATLTDVTVSGNKSTASTGGGIYNVVGGKLTLTNVTVSGNSAADAGGIYSYGTATLTNVTVTGNTATGTAGGVYNYKNGTMSMANVTISGNTANTGDGGGFVAFLPSTTTIANTIIAGNTIKNAKPTVDVSGAVTSLGFNLIGKTDGSTGWTGTDLTGTIAHPRAAGLGALANNGGPTLTLLPLTGSAVIDHGSNALIRPGSTTDQRGLARIGKAIVDIGAVEVQPPAGSIAGTVFADANANGKLDVGEKGIANIKVYLDANKNGSPDASEVSLLTDASGNFKFTNLPAGTFRLREVLPAGNALIAPVAGFFDIPLVLGASSVGSLFADAAATASISGRVFGDSNANGLRDPGEIGLGLWKVYLDKNKNGVLDAGDLSAVTDINGNWSFVGLLAGSYTVRVVPVAGDVATKPVGAVMTITLTVGQASINNLFGEKSIA